MLRLEPAVVNTNINAVLYLSSRIVDVGNPGSTAELAHV